MSPFDFTPGPPPRRVKKPHRSRNAQALIDTARIALGVGLLLLALFVTEPVWAPVADRVQEWQETPAGQKAGRNAGRLVIGFLVGLVAFGTLFAPAARRKLSGKTADLNSRGA